MNRAAPAAPPDDAMEEGGSAFLRFSSLLGLVALGFLLGTVAAYNVSGTVTKTVLALALTALVLGLLYVIPRYETIAGAAGSRAGRRGANSAVLTAAVFGLLIVGNWYVNRHSPRWDLTVSQRNSLSDQTLKILSGLSQDVTVTSFYSSQEDSTYSRGLRGLLQQYERRSPHVKLKLIDPDREPGEAQRLGIKTYPVTIFESGGKREETTGTSEQDFTSALLKVTRTDRKKIYFTTGHQERDLDSQQQNGFSAMSDTLKRESYDVDKVSLGTGKVPDDAAALVIAGPRGPFLDVERTALEQYLSGGGHVLLLLEIGQDAGLGDLLSAWHVEPDNDVVVDPRLNYRGDALAPMPVMQAGHRITSSLQQLLLPGARSLTVTPGAGSELAIATLLKSSDVSWGKVDYATARGLDMDPAADRKGPLALAVAVNKAAPAAAQGASAPGATPTPAAGDQGPKGRLVVVGNTEFASNQFAAAVPGNRDFVLNSVNWLAEDENLISIRAEPATAPSIVMTNQARVIISYLTLLLMPLSALVPGGLIWWRRR